MTVRLLSGERRNVEGSGVVRLVEHADNFYFSHKHAMSLRLGVFSHVPQLRTVLLFHGRERRVCLSQPSSGYESTGYAQQRLAQKKKQRYLRQY